MFNELRSDYDSAWKEALTVYFEPFMAFCFADVHADINWERDYETLDTELQEVIRDAETGRRLADKLVKVWLRSGEDALVLIHVEIQGQVQSDFAERMYIYNHRLFDRYRQKVFSFAVLGDESSNWRPTGYSYSRWGFQTSLQFPVVKLLDYQADTLEQSTNPFAIIISAHLETQATRNNLQQRFQSKLGLVRRLYERGYTRDRILELFRFIEWIMALPEAAQQEFKTQVSRIEEERRMPFITSFERDAKLEITRENVIEILEIRFSTLPDALRQRINAINEIDQLKQLLKRTMAVRSVEEFEQLLERGIEEEIPIQFITSFERDGIQQGKLEKAREVVIKVLETRFSVVSDVLCQKINAINDLALLEQLLKQAIIVTSVEEFDRSLA